MNNGYFTHSALVVAEIAVLFGGVLLLIGFVCLWNLPHRRGAFLGPLFGRELVRLARNPTLRRLQFLMVLTMLVGLFVTYLAAAPGRSKADMLLGRTVMPAARMQILAENYLICWLGIQMAVVLIVAPFLGAGGIVEERERNRLDFLLSSPLEPHEIVFGIFLSRVVALLVLMATGLPVLMLAFLFGGIDTRTLLLAEAITATAAVSHMAYAFHLGLRFGRMDAVLRTYFGTVLPLLLLGTLCGCVPALASFSPPAVLTWCLMIYGGNETNLRVSSLACVVLQIIGIMVYLGRAVRSLKGEAIFADPHVNRVATVTTPDRTVPCLQDDEHPIAWREQRFFGLGRWLNTGGLRLSLLMTATAVAASLAAVYAFLLLVKSLEGRGDDSIKLMLLTSGVAIVGFLIAAVFVAVRASTTIAREREKQTLDDLRMLPLDRGELIGVKLRPTMIGALLFVLAFALGTSSMSVVRMNTVGAAAATFLVVGTLLLARGLGCWCSVICSTSQRASAWTLLSLAAIAFLPMLLQLPLEAITNEEVGTFAASFSPIAGVRYCLVNIIAAPDGDSAPVPVRNTTARLGAIVAAILYGLVGLWVYRRANRILDTGEPSAR